MNRGQRTGHGRIWGMLFLVMPLLLFWALFPVIQTEKITPPLIQQIGNSEKKIPVKMVWDSVLVVTVHTPLESAATGVLVNPGQADEFLAGQFTTYHSSTKKFRYLISLERHVPKRVLYSTRKTGYMKIIIEYKSTSGSRLYAICHQ